MNENNTSDPRCGGMNNTCQEKRNEGEKSRCGATGIQGKVQNTNQSGQSENTGLTIITIRD